MYLCRFEYMHVLSGTVQSIAQVYMRTAVEALVLLHLSGRNAYTEQYFCTIKYFRTYPGLVLPCSRACLTLGRQGTKAGGRDAPPPGTINLYGPRRRKFPPPKYILPAVLASLAAISLSSSARRLRTSFYFLWPLPNSLASILPIS